MQVKALGHCTFTAHLKALNSSTVLSVLNGLITAYKKLLLPGASKTGFYFLNYGEWNCAEWDYFEKKV